MKQSGRLSSLVLAGLLTGCAVGPNYKLPESTLSNQWVTPSDKWVISGVPEEAQWWRGFGDEKLNGLIDRSVQGNLDLKIAESRVRQAREARIVASSGLLPNVGLNGAFTRSRRSEDIDSGARAPKVKPAGPPSIQQLAPPSHDAHGNPIASPSTLIIYQTPTTIAQKADPHQNLYQAGFDASWELDFWGGNRREREAATADLQASRESHRDVLITLLGDVARNYIELRGVQKQLAVTRENAKSQAETLELTKTRARAGLATDLDVARAEAQLATTESQVPAYEFGERATIYRLSVLMGEEPGGLYSELIETTPIPGVPGQLTFTPPADLVRRRPDVRTAERRLASETARIGVAKADLYPKFVLNGSLGLAASDLGDLSTGSSRTWSLGPSVSIPIFNAGSLRAKVRSQQARQEEAMSGYRQTILLALEEAENSLTALSREKARRESLQKAVDSNRRAVKLSNDLYKQGLIDFLSVLETQRALFVSESLLAESEATVSQNLVAVYKAMGGGWEGFLPLSESEQKDEEKRAGKDAPAAAESDKAPAATN